jgi:hypothetical protein
MLTNKYKPKDCLPASSKKIDWQCHICGYKWSSRVADRALLEVRCASCTKVRLKDGTLCDSMIEAYYCLLLKQSKVKFTLNRCYPGLKLRYDFYVPSLKLYIETTSYNGKEKWWKEYFEKINRKRTYVEKTLCCNFEFINRQLNSAEIRFVKTNMA